MNSESYDRARKIREKIAEVETWTLELLRDLK
jgi:hypothetical protein